MQSKLATIVTVAICLGVQVPANAQGTFQNLDFEQANVPIVPAGQFGSNVLSTDGVPGWTTYVGTNQVMSILHNNVSLGAAAISILGPSWSFGDILQGQYSVLLQTSFPDPSTVPAIAQTGTIPATAESVRFWGFNGSYALLFNGQTLPLFVIGQSSSNTVYAADVSSLANQTGELRFQGNGPLDNIFFSNLPAPEPSTSALLLLATALLLARRLWRRT